jgi:molybdopterin/thiamine biosynthesis adenylyltransferase
LIYGPRQAIENPKGVEIALGCPPQTVATVAAMQSAEALKVLTGRPQQLLRNKLWVVDLTDCSAEILLLK